MTASLNSIAKIDCLHTLTTTLFWRVIKLFSGCIQSSHFLLEKELAGCCFSTYLGDKHEFTHLLPSADSSSHDYVLFSLLMHST